MEADAMKWASYVLANEVVNNKGDIPTTSSTFGFSFVIILRFTFNFYVILHMAFR